MVRPNTLKRPRKRYTGQYPTSLLAGTSNLLDRIEVAAARVRWAGARSGLTPQTGIRLFYDESCMSFTYIDIGTHFEKCLFIKQFKVFTMNHNTWTA